MIKIRNKQDGEIYTISNAVKSEATKDSFINNNPITYRTLQNWHAIYSHRLLIRSVGNKAIFQFLLKDHLEVIL